VHLLMDLLKMDIPKETNLFYGLIKPTQLRFLLLQWEQLRLELP
jgi:hypothetical protein